MPAKGSVSAKIKRALAHYVGGAELDGVKACRMAGYSHPHSAWSRIKRDHPGLVEGAERQLQDKLEMDWPEVLVGIADVAKNTKHKDRLKALELLAKIHGKLDSKINVQLDRESIEQHLLDLLQSMAASKQELAPGVTVPLLPEATTPDGN